MNRSKDRRERAALRARIAELEAAIEASPAPNPEPDSRIESVLERIGTLELMALRNDTALSAARARIEEVAGDAREARLFAGESLVILDARLKVLEGDFEPQPEPEPAPTLNAKLVTFDSITQMSSGASIVDNVFTLPASAPRMPAPPNGPGGFRVERQLRDNVDMNTRSGLVRAYSVDITLDEDWDQGDNGAFISAGAPEGDRIVVQVHEGDGSPVFSGHIDEVNQKFYIRHKKADQSFEYGSRESLFIGTRNLTLVIRYSRGSDGYFIAYLAGKEIARWSGPTVNPGGGAPYFKYGVYGQPTKIKLDNLHIAEGPDAYDLIRG